MAFRILKRLARGLSRTRENIATSLQSVVGGREGRRRNGVADLRCRGELERVPVHVLRTVDGEAGQ